ncbi:MAG: hypothetical protein R2748_02405 [Bryobacterales bacterium]
MDLKSKPDAASAADAFRELEENEGDAINMKQNLNWLLCRLRLLADDTKGQDLVEYALLAGFVAVAAGALLPAISTSVSTIFSRMGSVLSAAAS